MSVRAIVGLGTCILTSALATSAWCQDFSIDIIPTQDSMTRANEPQSTFGQAGGLHVSGPAAVNAASEPQGAANSWLMFHSDIAVQVFNEQFGPNQWVIVSATLTVFEVGNPNNSAFNRGLGNFRVFWLANDNWQEGGGSPGGPGETFDDEINFERESLFRNDDVDEPLGQFRNEGDDRELVFSLDLTDGFTDDLMMGGVISLFLTAADDTIGFTFRSKDRAATDPSQVPLLTLVARSTMDAETNGPQPDPPGATPPTCGLGMPVAMMMLSAVLPLIRYRPRSRAARPWKRQTISEL